MRDLIFPSSVGLVCAGFRASLIASDASYADAVTVQPKLPDTRTLRMVTVRDDSGPDDGVQSRRRYGINVWAESSVVAESVALLLMAVARNLPDGDPITATDSFAGPFEVDDGDDPPIVVGSTRLSHYYFTFRLSVRGFGF